MKKLVFLMLVFLFQLISSLANAEALPQKPAEVTDYVCRLLSYQYLVGQIQLNDSRLRNEKLLKDLKGSSSGVLKVKPERVFSPALEADLRHHMSDIESKYKKASYSEAKEMQTAMVLDYGKKASKDNPKLFKDCIALYTPIIEECNKVPASEQQKCMEHYQDQGKALFKKYFP